MHRIEQDVPRGTLDKFHAYLKLLKVWNERINLSSRSQDIELVFEESALEAITISDKLSQKKILDIGSGGGLPGMFLGILGHDITLLEINMKKCVFLQSVISQLKLNNVKVINADIKKHRGEYDIIMSKAVTDILGLVEMSSHLINEETEVYLPKSLDQFFEIDDLEKKWSFELQKVEIKDNNKDVILILKNLISK